MLKELTDTELELIYGSKDPKVILQRKQSDKQYKSFSKKPTRVKITADECKALCSKAGVEYLEGYERRVVEHTISDETVDRDGDIVRAAGVDLKNYKKNPVILFAHNHRDFPIGNAIKIWNDKEEKSVKAWGLYFDERVDATGRSDVAFKFIVNGGMPAVSIGFGPREVNWPQSKEEREELGLGQYGVEFKRVELWEYSACPVPSNPNALRRMVKDGTLDKENCKTIIKNKLIEDDEIAEFSEIVKEVFGDLDDSGLETEGKDEDNQEEKNTDEQLKELAPDGFDNIVDFYGKTTKDDDSDKRIMSTVEGEKNIDIVYVLSETDNKWEEEKKSVSDVKDILVPMMETLNENIKGLKDILISLIDLKSPDDSSSSGDKDDDESLYDMFNEVEL